MYGQLTRENYWLDVQVPANGEKYRPAIAGSLRACKFMKNRAAGRGFILLLSLYPKRFWVPHSFCSLCRKGAGFDFDFFSFSAQLHLRKRGKP
jgi:hypothetical protein